MGTHSSPSSGGDFTAPVGERTVFGHPSSLFILFFSELWERFSYYGMRAILVLYCVAKTTDANAGLGWSEADATGLYGTYTGLVYLTPLIGGAIADNWLGNRRCIIIGGILMMLGHFLMAVTETWAFYTALSLLIAGNGFFKPNISTMVGQLYKQGDPRRDGGFTIFYMGINVGAFFAPLICGYLGEKWSYHYGFAAAGFGMAFGLVIFTLWQKNFGEIGLAPKKAKSNDPAQLAAANQPLTSVDIQRLAVILILWFFVVFFWLSFEQAGSSMNLFAKNDTDMHIGSWEMPASWLQAVNPLFIVLLGPFFSSLWVGLSRRRLEPPTPAKIAAGVIIVGLGFLYLAYGAKGAGAPDDQIKVSVVWLVGAYIVHTIAELCLSPVGLSMVTKLAPVKLAALMMGFWFLANATANKIGGMVAGMTEGKGYSTVFNGIGLVAVGAGVLLLLITPLVRKLMHGVH